mgnify:CR=1 FL=1
MNIRLQVFVAAIIIIGLLYIIKKTRKHQVDLKYALIWFLVGILYLLFDLIPPFQIGVAKLLGISSALSMLIFLAIGFIFMILFTLTAIVSSQTQKIRRLVQEVAILRHDLEEQSK